MPEPPPPATLSRRGLLRGTAALTAAGLLGGVWDCTTVEVRKTNLYLPKWDADGFRVVQVSDLHVNRGSQFERGLQAVKLALDHKAHLIALTGDYLNRFDAQTSRHLTKIVETVDQAQCPVVAIFGNHDWWDMPIQEQIAIFRKSKIQLLQNRAIEIDGVSVAGIDDVLAERWSLDFIRDGMFSKSMLALWHEPDAVLHMPPVASLQLSGHSHGGEICLPGGIPIHTPNYAKHFTAGFYPREPVPIFVSRGVGTEGPCRLYCPPEISVHTLYSSKGGPARMETVA